MNRKLIALIILAGCDPNKTEDAQSAYDEGYAQGYQDAADSLNADYAALEARLAAVESLVGEIQPAVDDVQAQIDAIDGELATISGLPRFIDSDLTLDVPSEYEDIDAALDAIGGSVISQAATVTIQVADGSYNYDDAIILSHENGDRIQIVGNAADPSAVSLTFALSGFEVSNGHSLGLLQGMTLIGNGYTAGEPYGVLVKDNGLARVSDVRSSDFYAGFAAYNGGVLFADGTSDDGSYLSYQALGGAVLSATYASSTNAVYYGFDAERSSYVDADNSDAAGAGRDCYVANDGHLDAEDATAEDCTLAGFRGSGAGVLNGYGAEVKVSSSGSGLYGFAAVSGGLVSASTTTASGVEYGYYSEFFGQLHAQAAASSYNTYGYRADWGGRIDALGATSTVDGTSYSPSTASGISSDVYIWY